MASQYCKHKEDMLISRNSTMEKKTTKYQAGSALPLHATMIKKPTVVLIPGAFAKSSCFDALVPYLQDAGYSTVVVAIPSSDPLDPSNATCQKDYDHVRDDILLPLIDGEGTDVLLFIHSYGGQLCPTGLSKAQRQSEGKKGGVIGLVYLAGNVVHEGASLLQFCGGQWPSVVKLDTVSSEQCHVHSMTLTSDGSHTRISR